MERLTKLQIIEETVKFYSEDTSRRALIGSGNTCQYNTSDGRHCAVGRCLLPELHAKGTELFGNGASVQFFIVKNGYNSLDEVLQEQYRGHDLDFWYKLQQLHDDKEYWDKNSLSEKGKRFVDAIKKLLLTE